MRVPLAVALAAALLAGCGSSDEPEEPADTGPERERLTDAVSPLKGRPVGVADVDGEPWMVLVAADAVVRTDGSRTPVGGEAPLRIVNTPAGAWVSVIGQGTVVRIDPATGKVDERVRLAPEGSEPEGLAWDGESLWVVDQAGDRVVEMDADGKVLGDHPVGQAPRLVAAGESGIWVANYGGTSVTRVAGGASETVPVVGCIGAQGIAEAAGTVWVSCTMSHKVVLLDATTMEIVGEIPDVADADAVVTDGSTVWVVGQTGPTVYEIDAETRELTTITVLGDAKSTDENVGAALVGTDLVVTHPDVGYYVVPVDSSTGSSGEAGESSSELADLSDEASTAAEQVASGDGLRVQNDTAKPIALVFPDGDTAWVDPDRSVVIHRPCRDVLPLRAETGAGVVIDERDGPCRPRDTWVID